ncbi:MAG: ATP-binding cassette domain-containing protein [Elusimicrobia bacterium]|nr:ATP-binding cassette domain-containing protein [Elusimicrobiota bacterium]
MNDGILIDIESLVKKYGNLTAVDGISFAVRKGECMGILGPNGAGKTTTVKIIQCISPSDGGTVSVFGLPAGLSQRAVKAQLGVVPQENDLDPDLTIRENMELFGALFDMPKKTVRERVNANLKFVELYERANDKIVSLSGGMKRRLLVARALLNEPKVMILDEPTTGLDPQARHMIWQRLRSLKSKGVTMVLNTQYMEEAEQLCDRLLIMHKGRILKEGAPDELIKNEVGEEVVEIRNHEVKGILEKLGGLEFMHEEVGDTLYLYCRESRDILTRLAGFGSLSVLRRPATLEDVFLRLTGRGLNE